MATHQNIVQKTPRPKGKLSSLNLFSGYNRDQKLFVTEAMLINSAINITGGVFLTGLLLMLGASNLMVGLIMSSGAWSMMLSLVSSVVVERIRNKRAMLTWVVVSSRLLASLPVFLPAIMGTGGQAVMLSAVMLIVGNVIFSLYNTGFTIFFMEAIPVEGRTPYIYTRIFFTRIAYTVFILAMGFLLDGLHKSYTGFILVFSIGLVLGVADGLVIAKIKGNDASADNASVPPRLSLMQMVKQMAEPLLNRRYVRYLLFVFCFFFFINMGSSYTSLYQLKYLHLSVTFITVYNTFTYVIMIVVTRAWARMEERVGRLKVLAISSLLIASEFFVYTMLTTGTLWLIVLSPILAGLGNSGFWASLLPYRYDLMPQENKTVYEGWHCFAYGAAALLGALVGGGLQTVLQAITLPFITFSVFQLVYFISGALAIVSVVIYWIGAKRQEAALADCTGG
jgi:Na+/melibiose symporter-like transporter